jgi:hypothetical protein
MDIVSQSRSPLKFFLLVFSLSIPFELIGAMTSRQLLPGLPISSLMLVCPAMAAAILVYKENKIAGVIELLKRSFDYKRIRAKLWYTPILLLMPGVAVLTYGLMHWLALPLTAPRFSFLGVLVLFLVLFVAALAVSFR